MSDTVLDNLKIYESARSVPANAKKDITGGRLKGKTDINPMWRIKALTEQFGPCGIGWKYEIVEKRLEPGANNEIAAFVDINLYVCTKDGWSEPIPGTGGSMFVAKETKGMYTSDECFKMALTDAISVSCKALGFGADVYWDKDKTKYDQPMGKPTETPKKVTITKAEQDKMIALAKGNVKAAKAALEEFGYANSKDVTKTDYENVCKEIEKKLKESA